MIGVAAAGIYYSGSGASSAAAAASSAADDLAALALPPPPSSVAVAPPSPSASHEPARASLAAEIVAIRPLISDTNGPLDRGTASLALWASANLNWSELKALRTTSAALFRKDPDQERGRVLCIEGNIQEIRAERNLSRRLISDHTALLVEPGGSNSSPVGAARSGSTTDPNWPDAGAGSRPLLPGTDDTEWAVPGGKVFFATIVEADRSKTEEARLKAKPFIVEALAVRSTGTLVDGDKARFCGVLTGVVLAGNDLKLEHRAVGLFDLPENTSPLARGSALSPAPSASAAH